MIYFHLHQNIALACKDLKNYHEYRYRPHDVTARRSSHSTQVPPYGDKRLDSSTVTMYGVSAGAAYTNDPKREYSFASSADLTTTQHEENHEFWESQIDVWDTLNKKAYVHASAALDP